MSTGTATRFPTRSVVLWLVLAALLAVAGRSSAAPVGERALPGAPALAAAIRLDRLEAHLGEARLVVADGVVVLTLRGADLEALAAQLAGGTNPSIGIRVGDREVLVAELRSAEGLPVGDELLDDPDAERIDLGVTEGPVVYAALGTSGVGASDASGAEPDARLQDGGLAGPSRVFGPGAAAPLAIPEPATATLFGVGLLGLGAEAQRARFAARPADQRSDQSPSESSRPPSSAPCSVRA